ncbi:MAG: tryptophan 7-halogenase [Planctomycetes bacterium]|nr:tryptophan 7-halogenase [Planctomycetota bacterium]
MARKPARKASKKPARKPAKKASKKPAAKPAKQPARKPAKKASKKPAAKPAKQPARKPAKKASKKPAAKPAKQPARKPAKKATQKAAPKPSAKPATPAKPIPPKPASQPPMNEAAAARELIAEGPKPDHAMVAAARSALSVTPPQKLGDYQRDAASVQGEGNLGRFDVIIVGGGPGGSTLAALLRKQGRTVCVVERQAFPRFRIGESLLPFSMDIWKKSGVLPKIHEQGYLVKRGARFVLDETLEEECFWFKNGLDKDHPYAFQVQRGPFDKLLLDHARELGAEVFQPCSATGWRITPDKAVLITDRGEIEGDVICDVTGRWTFMSARQNQRRVHPQHRKITCFAHFNNVVRCEQDPNNIIIARFGEPKKGWFWLIPFADGTTSVGVVADAEYYRDSGKTPHDFFWESVRASRSMAPRMENAKACCDVLLESDFSFISDRHVGDRWIKVGDSGVFVDPVFSSGVFLSTKAADLAAGALEQAFARRDFSEAAFAGYEKLIRQGTGVFWAFIDAFYNRDFLKQMVTSNRRPLLQSSITSLLAGDIFNENNALIPYLTGKEGTLADPEVQALLG